MSLSKWEIREWTENPVTIELMKHLFEVYNPQIQLERCSNEKDLFRAKGQQDIINILKRPQNFLDAEQEDG